VENLPAPKKGAAEVAKLTTGIAGAVAGLFAGCWRNWSQEWRGALKELR
jgi:hypothetical protein